MKRFVLAASFIASLSLLAYQAPPQTQGKGPAPAPNADPYANNPAAGKQRFPLAAPAGKNSDAINTPLPGGVNTGKVDPGTWTYGPQAKPPADAKIWNPVKVKMMAGEKVTGGTNFNSTDPAVYCTFANAGYDFIWMEMQHDQRDWNQVAKMWATCPHAKAVPGVRVAYSD